ncbi:cbb3-type cytochrome c oxidase subunit I [Sinorhizobium medicae]|uniref:cbb3-type cytochrome c oxidase subunit I n=1 Tax=Sinorhizobium medicae TaxID=110321 RepID=UPI000C79F61C|nr:cbb3-type cytochrome c oxidase subunit I [Sinorhizobium medicae]PLU50342.1 peptidase S41 [Sinorhizobium medicae]
MKQTVEMVVLAVGAFLALVGAGLAQDRLFGAHMWILFFVLLGGTLVLMRRVDFRPASAGRRAGETEYFDEVVKYGVIATVFWGVVGFLVGVVVALQLAFPDLNVEPWFSFGRMRPLHTSAVIFAFGGNALIATSFYVVQRTSRARLFGGDLGWFVFWGYQLFIVLAATGYLLGITQSREYAEPEWYVDLWLTIVWVAYLAVFLGTILKRKEPHIYVANWFYLAFIVTIAMLHIVNNLAVPVSFLGSKSYSAFAGVQDALTQWWYGHNAVGFFLTAGFLAMMYYFIPKQVNRPVYSYRLSIIHFWALIFMYIWAGPHHLHYTALPDWAQTLGMVFSIMLWMPSWGGMINGLMTLSGAWDKIRTDPVVRMMVMAVAFYGMATFEGPMMSIKSVNSLSHGGSLRVHLVTFARDLLDVLAGDVSLALNRLAIGQASREGSKLGHMLQERGRRQIGRRAGALLEAGRKAGLLAFDDSDEAYGALYGLVVSDWHLRMLLGEEPGRLKKDFSRRAERAVDAFLTLYGAKE